jgi:proteasome activator subunit 4
VEVYAAAAEQPALDRMHNELTDAEREVDLFFSDQKNVDRLIAFLALEEKKGKDKFNGYRFIMFKVMCKFSMSLGVSCHSNNWIMTHAVCV